MTEPKDAELIRDLTNKLEITKNGIRDALAPLGDQDGECRINTCDGCKVEKFHAIQFLKETLKEIGDD